MERLKRGQILFNNHLLLILMVYSLMSFVFADLNVSWATRFFLLFAAVLLDYFNCCRGIYYLSIDRLKIAYFFYALSILLFFFLFDSRKDVEMISYMVILLLCLFVVLLSRTNSNGIVQILRVFISSGILLSLYIIIIELFPGVYLNRIAQLLPESIRAYAVEAQALGYGVAVGGSIVFADYVIIIGFLGILASLLFHSENAVLKIRRSRWSGIIILVLFIIAVWIEGRRGELLCLVGAALIMFLFSFRKRQRNEKLRKFISLFFVLFLALLVIVLLLESGRSNRFLDTIRLVLNSFSSGIENDITSGRTYRWNRAIELFRYSPLFGIGWGRYANNFRPGTFISDVGSVRINYKYAHNDYLNILCEMGIVGTVLVFIPIIYIFFGTIKQNRRLMRVSQSVPQEVLLLNLFSLGLQVFWALLGLLDPVFYKQFFLCCYAFAVLVQDTALRAETQFLPEEVPLEQALPRHTSVSYAKQ